MSFASRQQRARRRASVGPHPLLSQAIEPLEQRWLLAAHIVGSTTVYSTIQAAVNAASAGATINVDAGSYAELVTITKSLTLRGAQAGIDARSNVRRAGTGESILNGTTYNGLITSSFYINANDVTIDGFIVQGNTSPNKYDAGIVIAPGKSGTHIVNNIIQNNVSGLDLANASTTDAALIQHNVFQNNNNAGEDGGRGILSNGGISGGNLTNITIDGNTFFKNFGGTGTSTVEAAIALESYTANSQSNIRITNNVFDSNGKAVLMWDAKNVSILNNTMTYCRDEGSGALRFEGGDSSITVQGNNIYDNPGTAIRIDNKATDRDNTTITITGNDIYHNALDAGQTSGLYVGAVQYQGALNATGNWWGSTTGPSGDATGTGDSVKANGTSVSYTGWSTTPVISQELAYWGTPSVAGSNIEAEDFDHGGEGVAYHDAVDNDGGRYRPYESVDIQATSDTSGSYEIFSTQKNEWLTYTISVATAGAYQFDFRVANGQTVPGKFHLEIDGSPVTSSITLPYTGSSKTWQTLSQTNVQLPVGTHVLKLVMDSAGNGGEIGNFNWLKFTYTGAPTAPSAPTNLTPTVVSPTQINLVWTNTANNQSGFNLDRSLDGITFTPIASNWASTSYIDTGLTAGTQYYYQVRATNVVGDSGNSNVATATTLPASSIPTYLSDLPWVSATTGFGTVQLDKSINGNPITLGGTVYTKGIGVHAVSNIVYQLDGQYTTFVSDVGIDDEENGKGIGSVNFMVVGDGQVLYQTGVISSGTVGHIAISIAGVQQLTLVATNGINGSIDFDHADWAGAYFQGLPAKPAAPSDLKGAVVSDSEIDLLWTNHSTTNTSVTIERSLDGVLFTPLKTLAATATSYKDTGLTGSTPYWYRVHASNLAGDSDNSNVLNATTLSSTAVPTYLSDLPWASATTGYGTVQLNKSINGNPIKLNGTTYSSGIGVHAVSNIVYQLGGQYTTFISDVGIDDEEIGKGTGSVNFMVIGDGQVLYQSGVIHNGTVGHIAISVAGVQQLTLTAANGVTGSIDFDHADWAGAYLQGVPVKPAAPSDLKTTVISSTEIDLAWTSHSTNQTSFTVERSLDNITFTPVKTVAATVTSYNDTGLTASTPYWYRVHATNLAGDSDNSPVATATTLSATAVPTYLSDLPWVSATTGYGTVQLNKSINGNPIKLNGTTYSSGIGVHAVSNIVYHLGGQYTTFISDVGIDDEEIGKGTGSVNFMVIGDGQLLYQTGVITSGTVDHIAIDVSGVQQLTLIASNGVAGSIDFDHADWAGAYLQGVPAKPAAPSDLAAKVISGSEIDLNWTSHSNNNTSFVIERSLDNITFTPVKTVAATATSYADTGLSGSTQYWYRVHASNLGGDSDNSNVAMMTTYPTGTTQVYLSDLPWASATAGFSTPQVNASIKGNPLSLRGTTYAKGIGTHAASTITYNLNGGYTSLQADVGIDDEVGGKGLVDFQIIGDNGQVLFDSGPLSGASPIVHVNVNLAGVQQLSLVATNAVAGSIDYDHADWANVTMMTAPAV